jgi:hypothetical protein
LRRTAYNNDFTPPVSRYTSHLIYGLPQNSLPILGIIAHYISEDNKLESVVLALKEIQGAHDGENIAPIVEEVLAEWGIISKLRYLQMDNASNNDTMIRVLGRSKSSNLVV